MKTLIGKNNGLVTRERIFETEDAIVVESTDQYEMSRKSVLLEDVLLITYHRETGWPFILVQSAIIFFVLLVAGISYTASPPLRVVAIMAAFAIPSIVALAVRLIYKVDVISIFGRRSRAAIRFTFRKRRAREVYGRLCFLTRQKQRVPEEVTPEPESAV